ncbi:TIGR03087 family PEP-CTERM/XrtA system glycosyltransferase [Rubripirellula sp.]|nr:TIGR03087 family PEP-CTERM/XrtA system glycosyltransferase [Rubripirellula sp.]MDB4621379.1 TIGR03087 family PEP-CTERM/XrtA system glycosyltransferase [Rubripirellula sp.]
MSPTLSKQKNHSVTASNPASRRRLLMLTHRVPFPPDRGDRIRSWNILKHLAKTNQMFLGCVSDEPVATEIRAKLDSVCERKSIANIGSKTKWVRAGISASRGRSLTEGLFWSPALDRTLARWTQEQQFDAVIVYCSSMLRYARRPHLKNTPHFVDLVDVDSQKFYEYADNAKSWKKAIYRTEANRVQRLEHDAVRLSKAVTLVSDAEAEVLCGTLQPGEHGVHGIANGVDTEYFTPQQPTDTQEACDEIKNPKFVFVGVMNYPPNVEALCWFAANVWPHVKQSYPHAELEIVGKHPNNEVLHLAKHDGIHVTGAVPDVRSYVAKADIVIAPLQIARGIQNKVLEALSMAKPVIASPKASHGINASHNKHLLIADTPAEWLQAIKACNDSYELRQKLSRNGRELICEQYTWQATLGKLDELLDRHLPAPTA